MEKQIITHFPGTGTFIVTENAEGRIYTISAEYFHDILADWEGDCEFVPANDARVFFAAWNGKPLNPHRYHDFESLLMLLEKRLT